MHDNARRCSQRHPAEIHRFTHQLANYRILRLYHSTCTLQSFDGCQVRALQSHCTVVSVCRVVRFIGGRSTVKSNTDRTVEPALAQCLLSTSVYSKYTGTHSLQLASEHSESSEEARSFPSLQPRHERGCSIVFILFARWT